jgi:hypothetical protein
MILFFMGCPMHSDFAKTTRGAATQRHQQGTFNANHVALHVKNMAYKTLAAS